jgi:hypothetical protein
VGITERITQLIGVEASLPVVAEGTVSLSRNHTVWGNRSRFITGPTQLQPDRRWVTGLSRRTSLLTTALTLPGLIRYGYPLQRH